MATSHIQNTFLWHDRWPFFVTVQWQTTHQLRLIPATSKPSVAFRSCRGVRYVLGYKWPVGVQSNIRFYFRRVELVWERLTRLPRTSSQQLASRVSPTKCHGAKRSVGRSETSERSPPTHPLPLSVIICHFIAPSPYTAPPPFRSTALPVRQPDRQTDFIPDTCPYKTHTR